jgi:hypothetical protein
VNRVRLSGVIEHGPNFRAIDGNGQTIALLVLRCGQERKDIEVFAIGHLADALQQFSAGDSISVDGCLMWNAEGKIGIQVQEAVRKWTPGAYRPNAATLNQGEWPRIQFRDK